MLKKKSVYVISGVVLLALIAVGCGAAIKQKATSGGSASSGNGSTTTADNGTPQLPAVLTEMLGAVDVKMPFSNLFTAGQAGDALQVNSQVKTGDDGFARVDLVTGTFVRISPNSVYTVQTNEAKDGNLYTNLQLELGRVFIVLNGGSLDVSTGQGVASVRGSYMMVMIEPSTDNVIVTCLEGHCGAENDEGQVDFGNGQKVILYAPDENGKYRKLQVAPMDPADFNLWMSDVPESYDMIQLIAKEVGIGLGTLDGGPAANCDQSKALGCDDHPGQGKGNDKNGGNDKGGGKGGKP